MRPPKKKNRFPLPIATPGSRSVLFEALDAFWEIIPDDYRFVCAATCGLLASGDRLKLEWYEEALKWPTDDQRLLLRVHWRIADLTQNNLKRRFEHYLKVYDYMLKLWGSRDYDLDLAVSWLDDVCLAVSQHQDDITPDMVPTLQAIADAGLEMADKGWAWETGATLSCALGPLVATTGLLLFKKSDVTHAREYLAVAEDDQELEATCMMRLKKKATSRCRTHPGDLRLACGDSEYIARYLHQ